CLRVTAQAAPPNGASCLPSQRDCPARTAGTLAIARAIGGSIAAAQEATDKPPAIAQLLLHRRSCTASQPGGPDGGRDSALLSLPERTTTPESGGRPHRGPEAVSGRPQGTPVHSERG